MHVRCPQGDVVAAVPDPTFKQVFFLLPWNCLKATSCNYLIRGDCHCRVWAWEISHFYIPTWNTTLLPSQAAGKGLERLQETPELSVSQKGSGPSLLALLYPLPVFQVGNSSAIPCFVQKKGHADFASVNLSWNTCTQTENYLLPSNKETLQL